MLSAAAGGKQPRLLLSVQGNNLSSAALNQPWSESRCTAILNPTSKRERLPQPHFNLRSESAALILSDTSKQTLAFQLEPPVSLAVPWRTFAAPLHLKHTLPCVSLGISLLFFFICCDYLFSEIVFSAAGECRKYVIRLKKLKQSCFTFLHSLRLSWTNRVFVKPRSMFFAFYSGIMEKHNSFIQVYVHLACLSFLALWFW